jgi:beta-lactamase class C
MRFLFAVALMALIASPSVAADRDAERIVTRQVVSIVPPDGAGGVAVALRIEGRSLFFNYGWADRANKRPITTDTLFNLASLRKVFEATLRCASLPQAQHALEAPAGPWARPESF